MRIIDLIAVAKIGVPFAYYPNEFPMSAGDDVAYIQLTGGGAGGPNVARPSFQVVVRSKSPATAESTAWQLFNFFDQKRAFDVGKFHVVFCSAQGSSPLYLGTDENDRSLYSLNFSTISEVL